MIKYCPGCSQGVTVEQRLHKGKWPVMVLTVDGDKIVSPWTCPKCHEKWRSLDDLSFTTPTILTSKRQ
jgi:hypothetical protein